jgi:hypothetical protein
MVAQLGASLGAANTKLPPRVQAVIDKDEIRDLTLNYCRGVDRHDEYTLRSLFHPDATVDHGPGIFQGTATDFVTWLSGSLQAVKTSHTMIGNQRIDLRGDTALVETYYNAQYRLDKPTGREDVLVRGRHLDRFERRPEGPGGVWKIMHRKVVMDWVRTEPVADIFYHQNPDAIWGTRTKADHSFHIENFPGSQNSGKLPAFLGRRYESKSIKY